MIGLLNTMMVLYVTSRQSQLISKISTKVFQIDPSWLIKSAEAAESGWICHSRSTFTLLVHQDVNLLVSMNNAWNQGLKTTYYLRSLGASQVEKSTVNASSLVLHTNVRPDLLKQHQLVSAEAVPSPVSIARAVAEAPVEVVAEVTQAPVVSTCKSVSCLK